MQWYGHKKTIIIYFLNNRPVLKDYIFALFVQTLFHSDHFYFPFLPTFFKALYNNYRAFISSSVTKNHETARIAIWPLAKNILYIQMKDRYQVEIGRI